MCALHWTVCGFRIGTDVLPAAASTPVGESSKYEVVVCCGATVIHRLRGDVFWNIGEHPYVEIAYGNIVGRGDGFLRNAWAGGVEYASHPN